ncbi:MULTISPECIES: hypothetical protein [Euryhalocaulis]|uniref:hypothetical protein n=1 Tax=Euryhalocaulis TaxID=1712422 RepID=UPI0003A1F173|nr:MULTISPECIES: hypothetical protein [Euryhalocaulis]MBA4802458.1 hypothetical protein [Euryhalocaulis sp.]
MRFILKAILSLVIVGAFMPAADHRDFTIPELNWDGGEAVSQTGKLCERSESVCDAVAESAVLADIAGSIARNSLDRAIEAYRGEQEEAEAATAS